MFSQGYMCGIFGYVGPRQVAPILLDGLSRLEYRGYDSAGICIANDALVVTKRKGRVAQLQEHVSASQGRAGIAHTRWATHGAPNETNAHPHTSKSGKIAIVHNGIIENHASLRLMLEHEGFTFVSETDSEVIAHLIEHLYEQDLVSAVCAALELLQGALGIAVLHQDHEGIVVARRGSPLIIGVGEQEMFVSSDVAALLSHTRNVVYLNDYHVGQVTQDTYTVSDARTKKLLQPRVERVSWTLEQIEKGGYDHFMLKEIFEQPTSIANALRGRIVDGKVSLSVDVSGAKRFVLVACGTSWHSALIGKHLIERLCRVPVEVDYASEFRYRDPVLSSSDVVVVLSQSGETADTLAALRLAKQRGAKTVGLVNVVGSTIAREVDSGVYLRAGPEIGVASTKAFTSQVVSLCLLALFVRQETLPLEPELLAELFALPKHVSQTLLLSEDIKRLASEYVGAKHFLYLGRGVNFPLALEGALKLKEISYIHAEGYPAAEMKHGPIALIDADMPVFFIATKDATYEKVLSNMEEVRARGGRIIALVSEVDSEVERLADHIIVVPFIREELAPVVNAIPLQLFAYYVAALRGLDIDKPRNLAKSVTVE